MASLSHNSKKIRRKQSVTDAQPTLSRLLPPANEVTPKSTLATCDLRIIAASIALILGAGIWTYYPALAGYVNTWITVSDYSHGFFVVPLAVYFLWINRNSCPRQLSANPAIGCALFVSSIAVRIVAQRYYLSFLDGWSLLLWLAAAVTTVGGLSLLRWSGPSIGFLVFMIPLPFGIEVSLSHPLQRIATNISCYFLQLLGQPAFSQGNVILVGDHRLEVAQACSGLRLFLSIAALAYAYVVIVGRTWWEKVIIAIATIPIAILCNSARIVATGILFQTTSGNWAHGWAHDTAGWGMIPVAAISFWLVQWFVSHLFTADEPITVSTLVQRASL
ncbi:MAG TPA: exosortase/archaeosortase family protein [Pyrinomonadaceae bacterium]|nr:exosortase/archaeosortase family protein [Pyrinomonadaceae bacterium]